MNRSLTEEDLIILPRITPGAFFFGDWAFDAVATKAHYDELFAGRNAEEIVRFVEGTGRAVNYTKPDRFVLTVTHRVLVVDYSVLMDVAFEDGIFSHVEIWSWGVK